MDNQTEDDIKRLLDFLGEINLDLAEFTVLTPFPETKAYDDMLKEGRIFDHDWNHYTADTVVYQPRHMSPNRLQELYFQAWDSFYATESQEQIMFKMMMKVVEREMENGTYRKPRKDLLESSFGNTVDR